MEGRHPLADTHQPEGAGLELRLLGGFAVLRRGVPLTAPWRTDKARTLVKLLALAPGHALHREQVLEWLWPGRDPATAANNLYFVVHATRRVLDDGAGALGTTSLRFRDGVLRLAPPGGLATDVAAFEAAARAAGDDPAACERALALYAGGLLPEDRYEDWATGPREALREAYLGLLGRLADLHARRGAWDAVIAPLERILAEDATREEAHAGLLRAFAATGRRSRALRQYAELRATLRRELDAEPDPATQALYAAILAGRHRAPVPAPPGNLPAAPTRFIGREREIAAVARLLAPGDAAHGARLVTLTGSGGCGKTRLALAVARELAEQYPDEAWLVELAALADPALVPGAVARALGVREVPGQPLAETLAAHTRPKRLLLVLDNCEHLLDACAELAAWLLAACPRLRVLATSRAALRVPGEAVWRVPSLGLPPAPEELRRGTARRETVLASEAARLLLDRIGLHRPGFTLAPGDEAAVAAICRVLDGIPLALELAAARVGHLALGDVATRLGDLLGLLTTGDRAVLPRHRTLRAVLEWSDSLLDAEARALLRRLAVFAGGGALAAIEAICDDPAGGAPASILDALARLVDQSLVQIDEEGGELRYRLLEMTRQFVGERRGGAGEDEALRDRHLAYYLSLAEAIEPRLHGAEQTRWLDALDREQDNLRAALGWALGRGDAERALRLGAALRWYWETRWMQAEGREWLGRALALPGAARHPARAGVLLALGAMARRSLGDGPAEASLIEARRLAEALGLHSVKGQALVNLSYIRASQGRLAEAEACLRESLSALRAAGDRNGIDSTLIALGEHARLRDDYPAAVAHYEEAIGAARAIGHRAHVALAHYNLGFALLRLGDAAGGRSALAESAHLSRALRKGGIEGPTLEAAGAVAGVAGEYLRAVHFLGAAQAWHEAAGRVVRDPADEAEHRHYAALARDALGAAAYAAAWNEGRALPLGESFAGALAYLGCDTSPFPPPT